MDKNKEVKYVNSEYEILAKPQFVGRERIIATNIQIVDSQIDIKIFMNGRKSKGSKKHKDYHDKYIEYNFSRADIKDCKLGVSYIVTSSEYMKYIIAVLVLVFFRTSNMEISLLVSLSISITTFLYSRFKSLIIHLVNGEKINIYYYDTKQIGPLLNQLHKTTTS